MILTEEMATPVYQCNIVKVLDGDTLDLTVNLGFGASQDIRLRLIDIDAPEIYGVKKLTLAWHQGMVAKYSVIQWVTQTAFPYYVSAIHKGIHGRWLGEFWNNIGESSLNDFLKENYMDNEGWKWYTQEPLVKHWFERNSVITPDGKVLDAWHNWGKKVTRGNASKIINRLGE